VRLSIVGTTVAPVVTRRRLLRRAVVGGGLAALMPLLGCGAPAPTGPPPTVTVLAVPPPYAPVEAVLAQQATAAGREIGARVDYRTLAPADLRAALPRTAAAGAPPDLAFVGSFDSAPLAARGLLRDLSDLLDRIVGLNGDLFPPLHDLATAGPWVDLAANQPAPVWAIPYLSGGTAWLVRRDRLAKVGLAPPNTFEQWRQAAQRLANPQTPSFGWGAPLPLTEPVDNLAQICLLGAGAPVFDAQGLTVVLNDTAAAAGLQALAGLYRADDGSPLAPPGVLDWPAAQVEAALAAGALALTVDFGGSYARLVQAQPALADLILASPPPAGAQGWFTAAAADLAVVFRSARAASAGAALLERLLQPNRYQQVVQAGRGSVIPPYAYLTKGPFWDADPNYAVLVTSARGDPAQKLQYATPGDPAPLTLVVAAVRGAGALAQAARRVVSGESAPAVATALHRQAQALAATGLAEQPLPTATPPPAWLRLVQQLAGH
jgi:ABC-type glycerol-3-phosphate transport system substrate-binding protein